MPNVLSQPFLIRFLHIPHPKKIVGSYISLAGMIGIWIAYTDVLACFLWLGCALVAISVEIYYLQKQVISLIASGEEYELGCLRCY